ncbi:MAG: hypothetical protein N4A50_11965 [Vallitalea sp.]|jgi:hypothetical protein|nr:hypothetical protein [Vallitalea sp.]
MINKKNSVKKIGVILSLMLLLTCFNSKVQAGVIINRNEVESNDSWDDANIVQLGEPVVGHVRDSNDVDYFSYTPNEKKNMTCLIIDNDNSNFSFYIIDRTDNNKIINHGKITESVKRTEFKLEANHECIVMIKSQYGNNSRYEISLSGNKIEETSHIDSKESEYNNTIECANILNKDDALISANIADSDDIDYFMFTAQDSSSRRFVFYPQSNADFYFFVYDMTSNGYIYEGTLDNLGESQVISFNAIKDHDYRVCVAVQGSANKENYFFKCWN